MTEPYYQDESVTLYHGDCRQVLPMLDDLADTIVTDPPYGDTSLKWDRWPHGWVRAATDFLAPLTAGGADGATSLWCFGSMRMHLTHYDEFSEWWRYGQEIVWEKHNGSGFHADRFKRVHEIAVHWYRGKWANVWKEPQFTADATKRSVRRKGRPAHTGHIDATPYFSEDGGPRLMRSVLQVRSMNGRAIHPTEKPQGILEPLIRYSCAPSSVVLDPFAGSGSTLLAAKRLGRRAIGVEADERYCEAAAKRLSQGVLDFGEATA